MKPADRSTQQEIVARAIQVAGSMERLADFLCRPLAELHAWIGGAQVSGQTYLALVDIVAANELTIKALDNFEVRGRKPRRTALADLLV